MLGVRDGRIIARTLISFYLKFLSVERLESRGMLKTHPDRSESARLGGFMMPMMVLSGS